MAQKELTEEFNEEFFEWEERKDDVQFHHHLIAGSIAGVVEHTSFLPIDNVKTHQQSLTVKRPVSEIVHHIRSQPGGLLNFWRGSSVMVLGCVPAHAMFFSIYEIAQRKLEIHDSHHYHFDLHAAVGALSSAFHDLVMLPCEGELYLIQSSNRGPS